MRIKNLLKRLVWVLVIAVALIGFGFLAVWLKQDKNWDLYNYHFYNGYAYLNGRLNWDVQPAQLQTYLNPIIDVPLYLLATHLSARVTAFVMGVLHGFNFLLLLGISYAALKKVFKSAGVTFLWALSLALVGFIAPTSIAEHGASMNDNTVTIPFLFSLWLLLIAQRKTQTKWRWLLVSGAVAGLAFGLKQSIGPYIVGLGAALVITSQTWNFWLRRLGSWTLAFVVGFLTINGHWMLTLWEN
ncbi:MAG: glycosyltransferase family 39 protein, partial [Parcubacteria group bacterium]